jgi:hypothetical protein
MRHLRDLRLFITGLGAALVILGLAPVGASSANISHSYHATSTIQNGSIVSLDPQKTDYVEPANTSNAIRILGVAVASNDSLLAVDPTDGAVQVATSGNANTLVSTLNGPIDVGDQIAVSPFNGVGVKAYAGAHVIGLAETAFNSTTEGATSQQVTNKGGQTSQTEVGYIDLSIAVGTDSNAVSGPQLSSLQRLGKSLTGHEVSTARVIISLVIAFIALASLVVLIYASIYGSIISIGRNPLAKYAVFRTLGSVLGMAIVTALIAGTTIFLLLH